MAPTPAAIDVEAEKVVEEIVAGRDLREDTAHVGALLGATCGGGSGFGLLEVDCWHSDRKL